MADNDNPEVDEPEDDNPEVDEPDEDAPEDDGEGDKPYTPPTAEEYEKLQKKLARQERRITSLTGKPRRNGKRSADQQLLDSLKDGDGDSDEPDDDDKSDGEAARWRTVAAQQSAATQLAAAGFKGTAKQATRLTKMLELADARPDRNGVFDFEDEIEELAEEYPELFGAQSSKRRSAPRLNTSRSNDNPPKDPTKKTSDALLRSAGYR